MAGHGGGVLRSRVRAPPRAHAAGLVAGDVRRRQPRRRRGRAPALRRRHPPDQGRAGFPASPGGRVQRGDRRRRERARGQPCVDQLPVGLRGRGLLLVLVVVDRRRFNGDRRHPAVPHGQQGVARGPVLRRPQQRPDRPGQRAADGPLGGRARVREHDPRTLRRRGSARLPVRGRRARLRTVGDPRGHRDAVGRRGGAHRGLRRGHCEVRLQGLPVGGHRRRRRVGDDRGPRHSRPRLQPRDGRLVLRRRLRGRVGQPRHARSRRAHEQRAARPDLPGRLARPVDGRGRIPAAGGARLQGGCRRGRREHRQGAHRVGQVGR